MGITSPSHNSTGKLANVIRKVKKDDLKEKFKDFWRCMCICHEVIQVIDHRDIEIVVADVEDEEKMGVENI